MNFGAVALRESMDIDMKKLAEYLWQRGVVEVKHIQKAEMVIRQFLKDQKQNKREHL